MDRLERILTVFSVVAGSHIQLLATDMRSHHLLVTIFLLDTFQEVFQFQAQLRATRQPQRKPCSHCRRERKQLQFFTDLTMVTFLGFFHQCQIFVQHLFLRESDTIQTNQLFTLFVTTPVSTGNTHYFNSLQIRSVRQVRTTAQVGKRPLRIGCDLTVFQFADKFCFIFFASVTEHFQGICLRNVLTFDFLFLRYQFEHFCFDSREITFFDCCFTRIHIVVEPVFNSRSDTELDAGI